MIELANQSRWRRVWSDLRFDVLLANALGLVLKHGLGVVVHDDIMFKVSDKVGYGLEKTGDEVESALWCC